MKSDSIYRMVCPVCRGRYRATQTHLCRGYTAFRDHPKWAEAIRRQTKLEFNPAFDRFVGG